MEVSVSLDMINIRVFQVHVDDFEMFLKDLDYYEYAGVLSARRTIGHGASEYKYKINIGEGAGAVFVGYQPNSQNPSFYQQRFDMKIEFNPNKHDWEKNKMFWVSLKRFKDFPKGVKSMDVAYDIKKDISELVPISLTGKTLNKYKTTYYYGSRGNHGYLKIYDKAKEEGSEDKQPKTRIEYTVRFNDPLTLQAMKSVDSLGINKDFLITLCDYEKFDDEIACYLYCIQSGFKGITDFKSRRKREKIKKALQEVGGIDFDGIYAQNRVNVYKQIKKCIQFDWSV